MSTVYGNCSCDDLVGSSAQCQISTCQVQIRPASNEFLCRPSSRTQDQERRGRRPRVDPGELRS